MKIKLINLQILLLLTIISIVPACAFTNPDENDIFVKEWTTVYHQTFFDISTTADDVVINFTKISTDIGNADYYYQHTDYNIKTNGFRAGENASIFIYLVTDTGNGWIIGNRGLQYAFIDENAVIQGVYNFFRSDGLILEGDASPSYNISVSQSYNVNDVILYIDVTTGTVDFDFTTMSTVRWYRSVDSSPESQEPYEVLPPVNTKFLDWFWLILSSYPIEFFSISLTLLAIGVIIRKYI